MAWKPIKLTENLDADLGGSRIKVDEGDYLGEIAGIRPSGEDYEKEPYWLWQLRIKKGPSNIGRVIGYFGSFEDRLQFQNGRMFAAIDKKGIAQQLIGLEIETHADFVAITKKVAAAVVGREVGFFAADSKRDPERSSDIIEIYSPEEFEARVAVAGVPTPKKAPSVTVDVAEGADTTVTVETSSARKGPKPPKAAEVAPPPAPKKSVDQMLADFGLE